MKKLQGQLFARFIPLNTQAENPAYFLQTRGVPLLYTRKHPFIEKLDLEIDKHLSDPAFSVGRLLRYAGTSRTDLHRKLHLMTGMSTSAYIRHRRLLRAADLLIREPEWSLGQIAFEVGFNSQSYFTRAFEAVYGQCPSSYRRACNPALYGMEHG